MFLSRYRINESLKSFRNNDLFNLTGLKSFNTFNSIPNINVQIDHPLSLNLSSLLSKDSLRHFSSKSNKNSHITFVTKNSFPINSNPNTIKWIKKSIHTTLLQRNFPWKFHANSMDSSIFNLLNHKFQYFHSISFLNQKDKQEKEVWREYSPNQNDIDKQFLKKYNLSSNKSDSKNNSKDENDSNTERNDIIISNLMNLLTMILFFLGVTAFVTSSVFLRFCIDCILNYMKKQSKDNEWNLESWQYGNAEGCLICGSMKFSDVHLVFKKYLKDQNGTLLSENSQEIKFEFVAMKLPLELILKYKFYPDYILKVPHLYFENGTIDLEVNQLSNQKIKSGGDNINQKINQVDKKRKPWHILDLKMKNVEFRVVKKNNGNVFHRYKTLFNEFTNTAAIRSNSLTFDMLFRLYSIGKIRPFNSKEDELACEFNQFTEVKDDHFKHILTFKDIPLNTLPYLDYELIGFFSGEVQTIEKDEQLDMNIEINVTAVNESSQSGSMLLNYLSLAKLNDSHKFSIKFNYSLPISSLTEKDIEEILKNITNEIKVKFKKYGIEIIQNTTNKVIKVANDQLKKYTK